MSILSQVVSEVFEDCERCDSSGTDATAGYVFDGRRIGGRCRPCKGTGQVLSDLGQVLLDGLRPWLAADFAEADHTHTLT